MNQPDRLQALRRVVLSKQAVLQQIYNKNKDLSLSDYIKSWHLHVPEGGLNEEFVKFIYNLAEQTYGSPIASEVVSQLSNFPLVSTIDHHGILGSPFFLNSNLIYSLRPEVKYLVCLSTAGVSLNNHTWPGSLLVTDKANLQLRRFSFFPEKQKMQTVLSAPKIGQAGIRNVTGALKAGSFLSPQDKSKLINLVQDIFTNKKFASQPDFSRQAGLISHHLWSQTFPSAPKLIYLPLESLVAGLLAENLQNKENIFSKLFLTPQGWQLLEKYFTGLKGAFGPEGYGSFLFWGLDKRGHRVHLRRAGEKLEGKNFLLPVDAENIIAGLQNKSVYPTSLVCFLVLLYYRVTCLGGFNQVNWLTAIKDKFLGLLEEMGEKELVGKISPVATDNFAETDLVFARSAEKNYKPALLDLYLKNDAELYGKIKLQAQKITLGESLDSQILEIYKVITPAANRDPELT